MHKPIPRTKIVADQRKAKTKLSIPKRIAKLFADATGMPQQVMRIPLATTWMRRIPRLGKTRNESCRCKSGLKYKNCCLRKVEEMAQPYTKVRHNDTPRRLRIAGWPSAKREAEYVTGDSK